MNSRVMGTDGKFYPGNWLSADDRAFLAGRVHWLSHEDGLSVRKIIATLAEEHGVKRSVGWVAGILRDRPCVACPATEAGVQEEKNCTPEHSGGRS